MYLHVIGKLEKFRVTDDERIVVRRIRLVGVPARNTVTVHLAKEN